MLAHELPRLAALAERNGVELLYSASVCGSVPVLAALDELRTRDTIQRISGIVNGSTNFILTMMGDSVASPPPFEGGGRGVVDLADAIDEARRRGFLEADASLDLREPMRRRNFRCLPIMPLASMFARTKLIRRVSSRSASMIYAMPANPALQ